VRAIVLRGLAASAPTVRRPETLAERLAGLDAAFRALPWPAETLPAQMQAAATVYQRIRVALLGGAAAVDQLEQPIDPANAMELRRRLDLAAAIAGDLYVIARDANALTIDRYWYDRGDVARGAAGGTVGKWFAFLRGAEALTTEAAAAFAAIAGGYRLALDRAVGTAPGGPWNIPGTGESAGPWLALLAILALAARRRGA
jgi:hypothetical protein